MSEPESTYPQFPPGFWRRVVLHPDKGWIGGAIEDDMHHFRIRFDHSDGVIVAARSSALRHPWTGCGGAPGHIVERLTGDSLAEVAGRDPKEHCTHLFDLAVLMAAHAGDTAPLVFDMRVADAADGRTTATLHCNGEERLRLNLDGTVIAAPEPYAGLDLKQVSRWKHNLDAETAELMVMLRRAVYVSSARQYMGKMPAGMHGAQSPLARHAPCYNYRAPVVEETISLYETQDFSESGLEPLESLDPLRDFAAL